MGIISRIRKNSIDYNIASNAMFECSTSASTVNKTFTGLATGEIVNGLTIRVKFANGNTASNPTLNGYVIYKYGTVRPGSTVETSWQAGEVVTFTFITSGSSFVAMMGNSGTSTVPTNHASTATTYGVGTSTSYGHVKVISGDLNGKTASDGYAASQSHTHSQYLEKLSYEWNKSISFGQSGYLLIGKFPCYDSNITIDIDSTTNTTYHATLVIATQNINTGRGGAYTANVYGDANNAVTDSFRIQYSSGSNKFNVYFAPQSYSKNLVHIRAVALASAPTESEICTNVSSIPTTDLITVTNQLTSNYLPLTGGTMRGSIDTHGSDIIFGTGGTSSNDSGDIEFTYGNGNEKCRIWTDETYTSSAKYKGPNYRVYDTSGNQLTSTKLLLANKEEVVDSLGLGNSVSGASWGTVNPANGYTQLLTTEQPSGGGLIFGEKNGQTSIQIDGDFYGQEGNRKVAYEFDNDHKLNSDYINCGSSSQKMYYQMISGNEHEPGSEHGPVRITDHYNLGSDAKFLVLMMSSYDINGGPNFGDMHIRGTIGGWVNRRYIDLACSCRQGSYNEDCRLIGDYDGSVNIWLAATGFDENPQEYYGRMCIVLRVTGYFAYDLWIEGVQADILPYSTEYITRSQLNNLINSFTYRDGVQVCTSSKTNSRGSLPLPS